MDDRRAAYMEGTEPWYFGWSNCNAEIVKIFREHYGRPYFLPPTSENHAGDWIFMGWPGFGAHMHVDNVRLPSWQAQLKGTKKWILAPPPECYYECESFEVVVQTGDISEYRSPIEIPAHYLNFNAFQLSSTPTNGITRRL